MKLDIWMEKATKINHKQINSLVKGFKKDYDAVKNAISSDWSSGKVEGTINKLKTIKRQMYGRAGMELLRRKVIFSKTG